MNETVEPKPGLVVPTDAGNCVLLYPERAGHPEGNWVGVLKDGKLRTLTQEEIKGG
jgi:hypothetical protein